MAPPPGNNVFPDPRQNRVKERHGDGTASEGILEMMMKFHKYYEKPEDGEINTYNVDITPEMSRKDVFDKVLEVIKQNY